jgi:hypothetical protein
VLEVTFQPIQIQRISLHLPFTKADRKVGGKIANSRADLQAECDPTRPEPKLPVERKLASSACGGERTGENGREVGLFGRGDDRVEASERGDGEEDEGGVVCKRYRRGEDV